MTSVVATLCRTRRHTGLTAACAASLLTACLMIVGHVSAQWQSYPQPHPRWPAYSPVPYQSYGPIVSQPRVVGPHVVKPQVVWGPVAPPAVQVVQSLPAPVPDATQATSQVPTNTLGPVPGWYPSQTFISPQDYVAPLDPLIVAPALPPIEQYETLRLEGGAGSSGAGSSEASSSDERAASVRLAISEQLLQRVFRKDTSRFGDVNDCVLGARITGRQQTNTQTTLRLVPCDTQASFEIVLSGLTQSETFGSKSIAGIVSTTNSRFEMVKPFSFDGNTITTSTPGATVWPQQTNQAAVALRGNLPVVRRVIGAFAYQQAEQLRPQSERITANRVTSDASTRFNQRVDDALAQLQSDWSSKVVATVRKYLPTIDTPIARTTSDHALFSLPSPWASATAETLPNGWESFGDGASFAVHESALNAGVDRLSLGGFEIAAGDWDGAVRRFLPGIIKESIPIFGAQTGSLVLDETNPAQVQLQNGQFRVILNARIKTPVGELPAQRITMPWRFASDETSIYATPDEPLVEAIGDESNPMMAAVRPFLKAQLETELLPLRFPRQFSKPIGEGENTKTATVVFNTLTARDGWMVIGLNIDVSE